MTNNSLDVLAERAVVALERIAGALAGEQIPHVPDAILVADLEAGMSLRKVAAKHGVGVGQIRGAKNRAQKGFRIMTDRFPSIWKLENLVRHCVDGSVQARLSNGQYVPARPQGFCSLGQRLKAAKLVFTGKADAVTWPGQ